MRHGGLHFHNPHTPDTPDTPDKHPPYTRATTPPITPTTPRHTCLVHEPLVLQHEVQRALPRERGRLGPHAVVLGVVGGVAQLRGHHHLFGLVVGVGGFGCWGGWGRNGGPEGGVWGRTHPQTTHKFFVHVSEHRSIALPPSLSISFFLVSIPFNQSINHLPDAPRLHGGDRLLQRRDHGLLPQHEAQVLLVLFPYVCIRVCLCL